MSEAMNRRNFAKWTAAALGGVAAGAMIGCGQKPAAPAAGEAAKSEFDSALLLEEPHVCRGLNTCKGTFGGKENDCAGLGQCATAKAHGCNAQNECKGQGGCGEHPGENACKGKGACAVPLSDDAWKKARANYEAAMTKAGKKFGPAPEKAAKS